MQMLPAGYGSMLETRGWEADLHLESHHVSPPLQSHCCHRTGPAMVVRR